MNRRENLKLLFTGSVGTGLLLAGCSPEEQALPVNALLAGGTIGGRTQEEKERDQELLSETFFTEEERKKLSTLVDIIMPKDDESPAATEVGVVDFMEFIMKDMPYYQTPMRGGLMWLDFEADEKFGKSFNALSESEVITIVDEVAWPDKATPAYEGAVRWFNMLRNLTCSGYFSTPEGWKYIGYVGNQPNAWDGVPQEVMEKHGVKLEEKYIPQYLKMADRGTVIQWDDDANIIG
ncbi:gluconate 2-dehydrogenase subunit 3 family protein [Algoriphagus sp.]|uniref:gluconate 2-dehydrogenase subunit 3 family protein n=1 Tax=Algoriphagus sp. TaxID=1872435 RepID=UPI003280943C